MQASMLMKKKTIGVNTVLLLKFAGSAVHDISGRHTPSVIGTPTFSTSSAKFNTAVKLGANQRISIIDTLSDFLFTPNQPFTFELWANFSTWTPTGGGSINPIMSMFNSASPGSVGGWRYGMQYSSSGNATIYNQSVGAQSIYASSPDNINYWQHLALCRDASNNFAYYINGCVRGTSPPYTNNATWIADVLDIGGSSVIGGVCNAWIEEVRVSRVRRYTGSNTTGEWTNFSAPGPFNTVD
jgi:hypothetical protein